MNDTITYEGEGLLLHHFWGDYYCTVGIKFSTPNTPIDRVISWLGEGWKPHSKCPATTVVGFGNSAWLDEVKKKLASWGADPSKIDSCAKSVDCGEPFSVTITVPLAEAAERAGQVRLL